MKFVAVVVLALCVAASAVTQEEAQDEFVTFVAKYQKNYAASEMFTRFNNFVATLMEVERHNAANLTWTKGINEFADMTYEEFEKTMLSGFDASAVQADPTTPVHEYKGRPLPNDVDWRSQGAVSPIKNQGSCGSCWAFGTTGAIESANKIKAGTMVLLSEQQLVDCAGSSGNHGCNGGLPSSAYNWIKSNGGICSSTDYPYTARDGTCKKTCKPVVKISGATNVGKTEQAHQTAVTQQPLSIGIDASSLKNYKSGIFQGPCGTSLNHAVLTIGWTADSFILKNSWGTSFGETGFFRFARNKNMCGMLNVANYPTIG